MNSGRTAAATLILEKEEVLSLRLSGRSLRVACVAGRLWATVDRSAQDHLLARGEARTFRGRGTLVIQALRTATARIQLLAAADLPSPPVLHSARRSQPWNRPALRNPDLL